MKPKAGSPNDALQQLWKALDGDHDTPPANSICMWDYAKNYKVSIQTAHYRLDKKVEEGLMKCGKFYIEGRRGKVKFYWLAGK